MSYYNNNARKVTTEWTGPLDRRCTAKTMLTHKINNTCQTKGQNKKSRKHQTKKCLHWNNLPTTHSRTPAGIRTQDYLAV